MTVELTAASPLDGHRDLFAGSHLAIREAVNDQQTTLRIDPVHAAAGAVEALLGLPLPVAGRTSTADGVTALWLGPDEGLLLGPVDASALAEIVRPAGGAVVDVSAQRVIIELSGPLAREVMAKGCALDLHPRVTPAGFAAPTLLAHVPVIVWLVEQGPEITARVLVRSTFARHTANWLLDAAAGD